MDKHTNKNPKSNELKFSDLQKEVILVNKDKHRKIRHTVNVVNSGEKKRKNLFIIKLKYEI